MRDNFLGEEVMDGRTGGGKTLENFPDEEVLNDWTGRGTVDVQMAWR